MIIELTRLSRNLMSLVEISNLLKAKSIRLVCLKEGIDTKNKLLGPLVFNIMVSFSKFQREMIHLCSRIILQSKRARGKMSGRPKVNPQKIIRTLAKYKENRSSINEILDIYGIARSTLCKYNKNLD